MAYSIKDIAEFGGVSTRTLRYYDEIGLLKPAGIAANGYRYYDHNSLLLLQQILFFRELDVPLDEITRMLNRPDFNLTLSLTNHRSALTASAERILSLIATIDRTLAMMNGALQMTDEELFSGFDETRYEDEVRERWGHTPQFAESQKKWGSYSDEEKQAIMHEGSLLTVRMVGGDPGASPDDSDVQAAVGEYLTFLNKYFYACDAEFLRNLADMWVEDPRFAINYERVREGGAAFIRDAVHTYCDRIKSGS